MTRQDAVNWLTSKIGQHLDYDHEYGDQCVDFWAFYYVYLTGKEFFAAGEGVVGAKDIWGKSLPEFTKVANNPNNPNQLPQPGDVLIYGASWGGGYGHVDVCLSANQSNVTSVGENEHGNPSEGVIEITRTWGQIVGGLIGWLSFNDFTPVTPMVTLAQLTQIYESLLHRAPDTGGITHYVGHYTYDFTYNDVANSTERKQLLANEAKETPSEPTKPISPVPPETTQSTNPPTKPPVEPQPPVQPPITPPTSPTETPPVKTAPQTPPEVTLTPPVQAPPAPQPSAPAPTKTNNPTTKPKTPPLNATTPVSEQPTKVVVPNPKVAHKHYTFWETVMILVRKVFGSWL